MARLREKAVLSLALLPALSAVRAHFSLVIKFNVFYTATPRVLQNQVFYAQIPGSQGLVGNLPGQPSALLCGAYTGFLAVPGDCQDGFIFSLLFR